MTGGRIVIFTRDAGWHGEQLCHAFANRGYSSEYVCLSECSITLDTQGLPITIPRFKQTLPDAVFVRSVPNGSLQEVIFYLNILHILKTHNIPVYNNARVIEQSVDKSMTSFLLNNAGLNTPCTWVVNNRHKALAIAKKELQQGYQVVSKPLFGSQGEGVRRLQKMADLATLASDNGIYYLQRFIKCGGQGYTDIRVFVVNGQAVAAMRRYGISWLNNVAQGAKCETVKLDKVLAQIAVQATQTLNMDYAGVDIISDCNGQLNVIEVNSIPAWKALESVCHRHIATRLVDDLIARYLTPQ